MQEPRADFLFVLILGILSMLTPLAIDMYLPAFLNIANDFSVSQEKIQTTLALFTFGFAFGQLFWGPLSDSYGRKPIILIGIVVSALVSLGITQVKHIEHFYALRFVQGFFGASPAVVTGALLRDLFAILKVFGRLLSNKKVLGYIFCNSLSYSGMFCFLSAGSIVYTGLFGVAPKHFGYFFLLNILVMMTATSLNGKFVTKIGVEKSLRLGLTIQLIAGVWLLVCGIFHLGLWATVVGVATYVGLVSVVSSSANAAILDMYPEVAGTANSLTGMLRFGIGSVVGMLLALFTIDTERPMVFAMAICIVVAVISYVGLVRGEPQAHN